MELIRLKDFSMYSKEDLHEQGKLKAEELTEGGYFDSVVLVVQARKAIEYLGAFVRQLDSGARREVNEDYHGDANIYGAVLSIGSTGDRLDYEADAEYKKLKGELEARAKWLKIATKDKDNEVVVDGEVVLPVPIKIASKEVLKIKL